MSNGLYYYGPLTRIGHEWYRYSDSDKTWRTISDKPDRFPFQYIDGVFCPKVYTRQGWQEAPEGVARLTYLNQGNSDRAWTVISFWDRTIDKRGKLVDDLTCPDSIDAIRQLVRNSKGSIENAVRTLNSRSAYDA